MVTIDWVEILAGKFLMGLSEQQVQELLPQLTWMSQSWRDGIVEAESPQRIINLRTFYISRFPITQRQFNEFIQSWHSEWDKPIYHEPEWLDHPVQCSWHRAQAFCAWIGGRLPSTYEWEKAARGTDGRLYPWGDEWDLSKGNFGQDYRRGAAGGIKTSKIGSYPEGASPYGVQDVVGNCHEYTMTLQLLPSEKRKSNQHYQVNVIRGSAPDPDALYPANHRVTQTMRGSAVLDYPEYTSFRPVMDEWQRHNWSGFRAGEQETI